MLIQLLLTSMSQSLFEAFLSNFARQVQLRLLQATLSCSSQRPHRAAARRRCAETREKQNRRVVYITCVSTCVCLVSTCVYISGWRGCHCAPPWCFIRTEALGGHLLPGGPDRREARLHAARGQLASAARSPAESREPVGWVRWSGEAGEV